MNMGISSYLGPEEKTHWKVYINLRSKLNPKIRVQKAEQGIESKGKAERREKELLEECQREIFKKEGSMPTFGEIVNKWEKYLRDLGANQENTIDDYVSPLRIWCTSLFPKIANEINKQDVRLVVQEMALADKSNAYQNKILNYIRRVYHWGKEEGLIRGGLENITSGLKINRFEEKAPEVLTAKEIEHLLHQAYCRENKWYPIWKTAFLTGMRSGELYALKWTDIDFVNDVIVVSKSFNKRMRTTKSTKSGYFRTVPMNQSLKELFLSLQPNSKTDFVLPRIREWSMGLQAQELRKFCIEIGIRSVKFHTLRACFATHLLNEGVSLTTVMKVAGWRELSTVQKYTRLSGIHERGATNCLDRLTPPSNTENIINFYNNG